MRPPKIPPPPIAPPPPVDDSPVPLTPEEEQALAKKEGTLRRGRGRSGLRIPLIAAVSGGSGLSIPQ